MTAIQKTMPVPADRRLRFDMLLPETVRSSSVDVIVVISDKPSAARHDKAEKDSGNGLAATLAACQEARDILSGKIPSKGYTDVDEFFSDLYAEIEAEETAERSKTDVKCP